MALIFALFTLLVGVARANIVSIDELKLVPFYFDFKYRYVFSDFLDTEGDKSSFVQENMSPLADAVVQVDLRFTPIGTQEASKAFVFVAESELLEVVLLDLESKRVNGYLKSAGDLAAVLKDYAHAFTVYEEVPIDANSSLPANLTTGEQVVKEGTYYVGLVYAPIAPVEANNISVYGANRATEELIATLSRDGAVPYLEISGEITQKNTHGYLNAEYYPLLSFYTWVSLAYLGIDLLWLALCFRHRSQLITLHHFLTVILVF